MATTILEALASEKPCGSKLRILNETLRPIYRLVERHMAEIEEAQSRGYSWKQINEVCHKLWHDDPEVKKIVWWKDHHMIEMCYHKVRKGKIPHRINLGARNRTTSKKYNVEVTEE